MIILGIDPGIATLGYGIINKDDRGNIKPIDFGVITTPKEFSKAKRLQIIYQQLQVLFDSYKPDSVAIEELFFNSNAKTAIEVAEARGVAVLCSINNCSKLYEYTPLQVKQALTGNGRAEKMQIQYMVRVMLGLSSTPKPDDAADALAVAITHAQTNDLSGANVL